MFIKTRAIVLRTIRLNDTSVIAEMLTEQLGRQSFAVKFSKTSKGAVKRQFFMPLTVLAIEFDHRKNQSLQHLREVSIAVPLVSIPMLPDKLAVSLFMAEFLYHSTRGESDNRALYLYVESGIRWLDAATESYANFHLVFMMRLPLFLGFFPNIEDYQDGSCFDLRNACFTSSVPLHPDFLYPEEAKKIITLMRMSFDTMHLFRMNRTERNRITAIALRYYSLHLPQMPELKSLGILKEVCGGVTTCANATQNLMPNDM